jgi:hypothetical protein
MALVVGELVVAGSPVVRMLAVRELLMARELPLLVGSLMVRLLAVLLLVGSLAVKELLLWLLPARKLLVCLLSASSRGELLMVGPLAPLFFVGPLAVRRLVARELLATRELSLVEFLMVVGLRLCRRWR